MTDNIKRDEIKTDEIKIKTDEKNLTTVSRPNLLRAWWPAAVWIGIIAFESTDFFSSEHTGGMLYGLLTHLFGLIDFHKFNVFHHYLRKTGHVIGYGMLSLLLLRGWWATFGRTRALLWRTSLLSWLGTVFVASMDEWHQSYIPSRTGTWKDAVLDSVAGLVFLLVAYFRLRRSAIAGKVV
ncbi:MAG TPA: VanZ family protein [Terriglobales bacterium]|jgi:VanZ family protein|nr:VanZ family protein [Terriglobales bacterium]